MKVNFKPVFDLHLKKILELHNMVITVRSVFHENSKYTHRFIDQRLCKLKRLYLHRTAVLESIDMNKASAPKECINCHYHYVLLKGLSFSWISAMDVMMYYLCLLTLRILLYETFVVLIIAVLLVEIVKIKS